MSKESSQSVAVKPVAAYVGGKRNLAATVIHRLAKIPHRTYAEPFVGMGGIFLRRPVASPVEVINDYSRDVATFFRVVQRHYTQFLEMMRFQVTTRLEFDRLMAVDPSTQTDLERAARFLYLQRTAFGGKVAGRTFGVDPASPGSFDITKLQPALEELRGRLTAVTIECLPYAEFITRYDRPGTLFYLDPPYFGSEDYYGDGMFGPADFERLADLLASIKGRFLLSINDEPEVRETFRRFKLRPVTTTYTLRAKGKGKPAGELLISN